MNYFSVVWLLQKTKLMSWTGTYIDIIAGPFTGEKKGRLIRNTKCLYKSHINLVRTFDEPVLFNMVQTGFNNLEGMCY